MIRGSGALRQASSHAGVATARSPATHALRPHTPLRPRATPTCRRLRLSPLAAATAPQPVAPKGRPFMPVIGETLELVQNPIGFFEERTAEFGPVFQTSFAGEDAVAVADAALINEVLNAEHKTVVFDILPSMDKITESPLFASKYRMEGKSVVKEHRADRKLLAQYFSKEAIASYYPYMQSSLQERIDSWAKADQVRLVDEAKHFAFAVMNTQLAGVKFNQTQLDAMDELWKDFTNGATDLLGIDLPFLDYGKGLVASSKLKDIIQEALQSAYDTPGRAYTEDNIATALLVRKHADGSWMHSFSDVAEMLRAILFAGHETTAGSICIMMHFLSRNPEVMAKVREEQAELLEKYGPELTPEMLDGTYTEATAVEVMRLQQLDPVVSSVGLLFRRAIADFELGGKAIKQGQKVLLATSFASYSVEAFLPTVQDFEPERWLIPGKSAGATQKTTGASAFGSGPRVCAGEALAWAELKVWLSLMGRGVTWDILNADAEWKKQQGSLFKMPVDGMLTQFRV